MNYEDVQAILGETPVKMIEQAVNEALVASRAAGGIGGSDALELLLTSQLAAVIITRIGRPEPLEAADRVADWLRVLVEEAVRIRDEARLEGPAYSKRDWLKELN